MSISIQIGYPDVPKSITNPNVKDINALDINSPMSFLLFIKTINASFEPDSLQTYYNEYLKSWNSKQGRKIDTNAELITERYRDFIKDISLNYTNPEEKRFLSKIDFNDPYDLDVAISFYSKKLKEISVYYNLKREEVKFGITKKKLVGTSFGLERTIIQSAINHVESLPDSSFYLDLGSLRSSITVEIEELYDTYPTYFNRIPNESVYDDKDLDYGYDIFLKNNDDLIAEIFSGISDELKELKEVDTLFDTKRKLTRGSVSTDFYFLSTGNTVTDFISGKLFEATSPQNNILNRDYPTTATTPKFTPKTPREVGFFRPINSGVIFIDGINASYKFNFENLEPNTIYYFPDPTILGKNDTVLSFFVDDSFLKRNFSSGNAINQPVKTDDAASYYGYVSKQEHSDQKYLDSLFDSGYISDSKRDLQGNLFGLFKIDQTFESGIEVISQNVIKSLLLNGHQFFDDVYGEGYAFDYTIFDDTTFSETIRSGLSSYTNGFDELSGQYHLFMRSFSPFEELKAPTEQTLTNEYVIHDAGFFSKSDGTPYADPISSDLEAFPGAEVYYFTELLEAGLYDAGTLERALLDPIYPTIVGDFTQTSRPLGNNGVELHDGGNFGDPFEFEYSFGDPSYTYIPESSESTSYSLLSTSLNTYYNDRIDLVGKMYVRNYQTGSTSSLLNALPYIQSKYTPTIYSELSGSISKFEISYDTIFIETANNLVVDKLVFTDGTFQNPKTSNIVIPFNSNNFNKISNRFKRDGFVYYSALKTLYDTISSNDFILYPEIYEYDLINHTNTLVFPLNMSQITEQFSVSGRDVRYTDVGSPVLTYSSRNELFNISFIMKDQNRMFAVHEYLFDTSPNVKFIEHNIKTPSEIMFSNIMNDQYSSNLVTYLSSGPIVITEEELVI